MKNSTIITIVIAIFVIVGVIVYSTSAADKDNLVNSDGMEQTIMEEKVTVDSEDTLVADEEAMENDIGIEEESMMVEADMVMDLKSFSFTPDLIEIPAGETMTIKLTNSGGFHDFVVDELDVASEQINEGDTTIVTITAPLDAAGDEYEFYCSVGNHRAQGMVGIVKVI